MYNSFVANLVEHKSYKDLSTQKKAKYIIKNLVNFNHNYGHDAEKDEVKSEKNGVSGDGVNVREVLQKLDEMT